MESMLQEKNAMPEKTGVKKDKKPLERFIRESCTELRTKETLAKKMSK